MKELQELATRCVTREDWTDEQYAARQICKAVEELGELAKSIIWQDENRFPQWWLDLGKADFEARRALDGKGPGGKCWGNIRAVNRSIAATELADVIVPLLVLADTLGIDLEQAIRDKVAGVRGEAPEADAWWCSQCGVAMDATEAQKRLAEEGAVYCDKCKKWWNDNPPEPQAQWVPLSELRPGAIFETRDGARGFVTANTTYGWPDCLSLDDGEYMWMDANVGGATLVREIVI